MRLSMRRKKQLSEFEGSLKIFLIAFAWMMMTTRERNEKLFLFFRHFLHPFLCFCSFNSPTTTMMNVNAWTWMYFVCSSLFTLEQHILRFKSICCVWCFRSDMNLEAFFSSFHWRWRRQNIMTEKNCRKFVN